MSEENGSVESGTSESSANENSGFVEQGNAQQAQQPSETETLARAEFSDLKQSLAKAGHSPDLTEKAKFESLSKYLYGGGPVPKHMQTQPRFEPNAPHDGEAQVLADVYHPAQDASQMKHVFSNTPVPISYNTQDVQDLKQLSVEMGLSPTAGNILIERMFHHVNNEIENDLGMSQQEIKDFGVQNISESSMEHIKNIDLPVLDEVDQQEHFNNAVNAVGGDASKFEEMGNKALKYLENTLPAEKYNEIVKVFEHTPVMYDVQILQKLAGHYDARWGS